MKLANMVLTTDRINIIIDKVLPTINADSNEGNMQLRISSEVHKLMNLGANVIVTIPTVERIIDVMVDKELIIRYDKIWYRLTDFGMEVLDRGGWLTYLNDLAEGKRIDSEIKELTLKQLKGTIFQIKYWWLFLIFAAIAGGLFGELFDYLFGLIPEK